jgi:hypothetical protein
VTNCDKVDPDGHTFHQVAPPQLRRLWAHVTDQSAAGFSSSHETPFLAGQYFDRHFGTKSSGRRPSGGDLHKTRLFKFLIFTAARSGFKAIGVQSINWI